MACLAALDAGSKARDPGSAGSTRRGERQARCFQMVSPDPVLAQDAVASTAGTRHPYRRSLAPVMRLRGAGSISPSTLASASEDVPLQNCTNVGCSRLVDLSARARGGTPDESGAAKYNSPLPSCILSLWTLHRSMLPSSLQQGSEPVVNAITRSAAGSCVLTYIYLAAFFVQLATLPEHGRCRRPDSSYATIISI